jgi:hypothetical protein
MKCSEVNRALAAALLLGGGCAPQPEPIQLPAIDPEVIARRALEHYDRNRDARLDPDELRASPGLAAAFHDLDADKDGRLSADEIVGRLRRALAAKPSLDSNAVQVLVDNRPLSGATVRFVPDPIMGPAHWVGEGRTDESGTVTPRMPGFPAAGVFIGYYRVEVLKPVNGRETVPARYNQQTELGCEVLPSTSRRGEIIPTFRLTLRP